MAHPAEHGNGHDRRVMGAAVTLAYQHLDEWGDPADAGTTPTVTSVYSRARNANLDAGDIGAVSSPATDEPAGLYKSTVAASANDRLDEWVVTWTADGVDHERLVNLVGRPYFALSDVSVAEYETYETPNRERARRARAIAEQECERLTGRCFVPTLRVIELDIDKSAGDLLRVPDLNPRELVLVHELDSAGAIDSSWTAAERDATTMIPWGAIRRLDGSWPAGPVRIGYEHGFSSPPDEIVEAVMRRYRYWLAKPASAVPDRAISYSVGEGGTFRLSTPGPNRTGDPDVDAIYLSPDYHVHPMARW